MVGRSQVIAFVIARAGGRILRRLPDPLLRRVVPGSRSAAPELASMVPDASTRLLIGPTNSAGQGRQWARALERELDSIGVVSMAVARSGEGYGFPVDQLVPLAVYRWSRGWSRAQRSTTLSSFTHVLVESGRQLFGDTRTSSLRELRELRSAGLGVGLLFHGSDLRSPRRHAGTSRWSPFRDPWALAPSLELRARENARLASRLGVPVFVTTPDLLDDVPFARWLPVVVDPSPWRTARPALRGTCPVVAHAPSSGHLKGTELIEPTLRALHDEGVIEYRPIVGVPSGQMPAQYRDVDVVLDQFRIGAYGVVAVEAMSAGRAVIGRIEPRVRDRIRQHSGRDLPIIDADPETLESVLRGIAADPAAARAAAAAGPAYAAEVHGGTFSARVLGVLLG